MESIKQLWNESLSKADFIAKYKTDLAEMVKDHVEKASDHLKVLFFKNFNITLPNPLHYEQKDSEGNVYAEFDDPHTPGLRYRITPATGRITAKKNIAFSSENKRIDFSGSSQESEFLCAIPNQHELENQILDVASYLPDRPQNHEDLEKKLESELEKRMNYQIGDIEKTAIQKTIENAQLRQDILSQSKAILTITEDNLHISQERNKAYYEMMVPLLNTLDHSSNQDLLKLKAFISRIKDYL